MILLPVSAREDIGATDSLSFVWYNKGTGDKKYGNALL